MPNRIIKESITTSCDIDQLTAEEERFFYRLIVVCDDFGRMDARLPIIKARCYPLKADIIKISHVGKWLDRLIELGMVKKYIADNKEYLFLTSWEAHQQKRAKYSKYPEPENICNQMQSDEINSNQLTAIVTEKREYENTRNEKRESDLAAVWEYYEKKLKENNKSRTLTDAKRKHLNARLKEFSVDQLKKVIDNVFADPFMLGANDRNKAYLDIENFLSSTDKAEKWLDGTEDLSKQQKSQKLQEHIDRTKRDIQKIREQREREAK